MSPARLLGARPVGREHLDGVSDELDKLEAATARAVNEGDLMLAENLREKWIEAWNASPESRDG
jgi:hypothetical protein